eukprot:6931224-Pyramimonas_sp.AAC.1
MEQRRLYFSELKPISLTATVTISSPISGGHPWIIPAKNVGGHDFVEMEKGGKDMKSWLLGCKTHDERASE